jgi:putative transposase
VRLSKMGVIVQRVWLGLPNHYSHVLLDALCIMPNHVHVIIILTDTPTHLQWPSVPDQIREKSNIESNNNQTRPYPPQWSAEPDQIREKSNIVSSNNQTRPYLPQWPSVPDQIREKSNIESNKNQTRPYTRYGLPEIVRAVKSFSSRRINRLRGTPGVPVWQRNYYERIIRNEKELNAIRLYILDIPLKWEWDWENPAATHI